MKTQKEVEELLDKRIEKYESLDNPFGFSPDVVALKSAISTLLDVLDFEDTALYKKYREGRKHEKENKT